MVLKGHQQENNLFVLIFGGSALKNDTPRWNKTPSKMDHLWADLRRVELNDHG